MITPEQIESKDFKKVFRGYSEEEVDVFLDEIKEDYEALIKEKEALKEKLAMYEGQISKYANIENTLKETLITAQAAAEDTTNAANKKAKVVVQEAELNARQIIEKANNEVVRIRTEYEELIKEYKVFRNKFKSLLEDEAKNIDEIFSNVDGKTLRTFEPKVSEDAFANPETLKIEEFDGVAQNQEDVVEEVKQDAMDLDESHVEFEAEDSMEATQVVETLDDDEKKEAFRKPRNPKKAKVEMDKTGRNPIPHKPEKEEREGTIQVTENGEFING